MVQRFIYARDKKNVCGSKSTIFNATETSSEGLIKVSRWKLYLNVIVALVLIE